MADLALRRQHRRGAGVLALADGGGTGQRSRIRSIIYRSGTFPEPGDHAQEIVGPVLTDGFLNEFRYLDEDNTIPLDVAGRARTKPFVVALASSNRTDPRSARASSRQRRHPHRPQCDLRVDIGRRHSCGSRTRRSRHHRRLGHPRGRRLRRHRRPKPMSASRSSRDSAQYTAGAALTYTITIGNAGPARVRPARPWSTRFRRPSPAQAGPAPPAAVRACARERQRHDRRDRQPSGRQRSRLHGRRNRRGRHDRRR